MVERLRRHCQRMAVQGTASSPWPEGLAAASIPWSDRPTTRGRQFNRRFFAVIEYSFRSDAETLGAAVDEGKGLRRWLPLAGGVTQLGFPVFRSVRIDAGAMSPAFWPASASVRFYPWRVRAYREVKWRNPSLARPRSPSSSTPGCSVRVWDCWTDRDVRSDIVVTRRRRHVLHWHGVDVRWRRR